MSTKRNAQQDAMKNNKPTVDGIKFATSMKWQTSMSHNNRHTDKTMFRTPVPPKFNVGMCMQDSVLRNLRASSTLTLRPLYATQHWKYGVRGTQQPVFIWLVRVHWCCELYSVNSLLECGQRPLTHSLDKQACTSVRTIFHDEKARQELIQTHKSH